MAKEEKQVIVLPNGEGENKPYWTIANYGRCTWKHKWWVLGSTALVTLAAFLVVRLAVNPSRTYASSKYSYNLATQVDEDGTVRYLSGEIFNFTDVLSRENLEAVKNSSKDYASIDVNKMVDNNHISVVENEKSEKNPNEETTYTLKVRASYFSSNDQMRNFVNDVVYSLQNKSNEAIKQFTVDKTITNKFSTLEFDQQIIILNNQYKNIEDTYTDLAEKFTSSAKLAEGSLSDAMTDFKETYKEGSDTVFSKLSASIYNEGLAVIPTTIDAKVTSLKTQAENYKTTLKNNVALRKVYSNEIDTLTSPTMINNASTDYTKKLLELSESIAKIDTSDTSLIESLRIYGYTDGNVDATTLTNTIIDGFVYDELQPYCQSGIIYKLANAANPTEKKAACDAFGAELKTYAEQLLEDVEIVNGVHHYLYNTFNNKVNFYTPGIVSTTGNISNVLITLVAAAVALVASSLIATAIEISKQKEEDAKK